MLSFFAKRFDRLPNSEMVKVRQQSQAKGNALKGMHSRMICGQIIKTSFVHRFSPLFSTFLVVNGRNAPISTEKRLELANFRWSFSYFENYPHGSDPAGTGRIPLFCNTEKRYNHRKKC